MKGKEYRVQYVYAGTVGGIVINGEEKEGREKRNNIYARGRERRGRRNAVLRVRQRRLQATRENASTVFSYVFCPFIRFLNNDSKCECE